MLRAKSSLCTEEKEMADSTAAIQLNVEEKKPKTQNMRENQHTHRVH